MKKVAKRLWDHVRATWAAQRGQSLVEITLVFPILILLLAGLIEVGLYANHYLTVLDASREGARLGADGDPDPLLLQPWTHTGGVSGDPIELCEEGPDPADPSDQITDMYFKIACLAYRDLHPLTFVPSSPVEDVVVSIFAIAPITSTPTISYEIKLRPNLTDTLVSGSLPGGPTTHFHYDVDDFGYYAFLDNFDPGNPIYSEHLSVADMRAYLDANPPTGAIAFLLVEVWWEHSLMLNLPFTQSFFPDPFMIHTYTLMPISAAEPTPTPGPSPTPIGAGATPTQTPTPTETPPPGSTNTPTPTPVPGNTDTPTPTLPSPTDTPTPTPTPTLPPPWQHADVGPVGLPGLASYAGGVFTVSGSGTDIWGSSDEFHFVHQPLVDTYCQITARITSFTGTTHGWAKAGVMFKDSTSPFSNYVMIGVTPSNGITFQWNFSNNINGAGYSFPEWLRIVRNGNSFSGYYSDDGVSWTLYQNVSVPMSSPVEVGMFVTSHDDSNVASATFDNVSVVCAPPPTATPTPTVIPTPSCLGLVQEAEVGVRRGAFEIGTDAAASGGQYVHVPPGNGDQWSLNEDHKVTFCVNVATTGIYRIRGWVHAASGNDDSFYVRVEGSPAGGYLWDTLQNTTYQEDYVNDRDGPDPVEVLLTAGQRTVEFFWREDGTRLDRFELVMVGTPTPTPTNTPTATPTPTPTPEIIAWDDFESGNGTGGGGWSNNWNLGGDNSAIVSSDSPHGGTYHLRERRTGFSTRTVNLTGVTNARLQLWWKAYSLDNASEQGLIQVSDNGGGTWWDILTVTFAMADNVYHYVDLDLSPFAMVSDFRVRVRIAGSGNGDYFWVDDIYLVGYR